MPRQKPLARGRLPIFPYEGVLLLRMFLAVHEHHGIMKKNDTGSHKTLNPNVKMRASLQLQLI